MGLTRIGSRRRSDRDSRVPPQHFGGERGRSDFVTGFRRQLPVLFGSLALGFVIGCLYRAVFYDSASPGLRGYVLSGLNGVGIGFTAWAVQLVFISGSRSDLGEALRRWPVAVELLVRALVMTMALVVVGLVLQFVLFPSGRSVPDEWLRVDLPRIMVISFAVSLIFRLAIESRQFVGSELLMSALLGTYHRPARRELIVVFLDLASSTTLAESMGEVRVHDLITRFFYDIDEPIRAFGGRVHSYVGDEAIFTWPVSDDPARNARCIACFTAIEAKMARLAPSYQRAFGVVPNFRAGIHAGPVIVSECGESKRQLAYFGDTMNVAARLCDYCKAVDARLVVSGEVMRLVGTPAGIAGAEGQAIAVRGREEQVEAHVVRGASHTC